jgi:hypothetical protein
MDVDLFGHGSMANYFAEREYIRLNLRASSPMSG